jgi:hypothetical protein
MISNLRLRKRFFSEKGLLKEKVREKSKEEINDEGCSLGQLQTPICDQQTFLIMDL